MKNTSINIKVEVALDKSKEKSWRTLMLYSIAVCSSNGAGYVSIKKYIDTVMVICGVSQKTAKRWVQILKESDLATVKKGYIRHISRKTLESRHKCNRTQIRFELHHLSSFTNFKYHIIRQIALLTQKRFESVIRRKKGSSAKELCNNGKIQGKLEYIGNPNRTGCSISQLQTSTGFDKKTISAALKGHTIKMVNKTSPIKGKVFRKLYKAKMDDMSLKVVPQFNADGIDTGKMAAGRSTPHKFYYKYNKSKDTYTLYCAIASRITSNSYLSRSRVAAPAYKQKLMVVKEAAAKQRKLVTKKITSVCDTSFNPLDGFYFTQNPPVKSLGYV